MNLLDVQIIHNSENMSVKVTFNNNNYVKQFGETTFYKYWNYDNLFNINISIAQDHLNLNHFAFLPRRIYEDTYVYDYLNIDEKLYFKGLGHKILCSMLSYGLNKYYNKTTDIYVQPSELYFADSLMEEIPDISNEEATESFKNLVRYYEFLGFNPTESIDWNDPKYKIMPKVSTYMKSTIGNLLTKCD